MVESLDVEGKSLTHAKLATTRPIPSLSTYTPDQEEEPIKDSVLSQLPVPDKELSPTFSPEKINEEVAKYLYLRERALFDELYGQLVKGETHRSCTILVSSARLGEGATTLALGLSTIAADKGEDNVLLIDSNASHPSISNLFGLQGEYGFTDLISQVTPSHVKPQETPLANLWTMGAGTRRHDIVGGVDLRRINDVLLELSDN